MLRESLFCATPTIFSVPRKEICMSEFSGAKFVRRKKFVLVLDYVTSNPYRLMLILLRGLQV
jgi:hypothetical protein